ncbi:molybdopterin molybdotransferase MoeA [Arthrobacter gandavensis]|uniref:molybdopterin molybdotransferase MoeA n=1 Tax=Arthrobacter gandavensis TaxID=169960 RepID=UPI00188F7E61|nr:gephyrin-like molybdotransferase Glp [Arthrobacter gandavensis]MBF4992827.1 molybdopterin molybdotransferase MoeA [Arthrobacter gandavensis]
MSTGSRVHPVAEHQQAVRALLANSLKRQVQQRTLAEAAGRILAEDVPAPRSLPPFANSQMDGYAVRSAELAVPDGSTVELQVAAPIPAGTAAPELHPGTAAPIMTGAMLPAGADAVVPIERAQPDSFFDPGDLNGARVLLPAGVRTGQFVRAAGSDIPAGTRALAQGTRLGPAQLGLLAALGIAAVPVLAPVRVTLLSTGDEVVEPGVDLAPGQIHDANTTLLTASLRDAGAEVVRSRILADSPEDFLAALRSELYRDRTDLVVTSGGISKGAYEVVRLALEAEGVAFLSVAMQPGGPQGIGMVDGVPFLGFPGNPVSALVSCEVFLRPALSALTGLPRPRPAVTAVLDAAADSPEGKLQVRRGRFRDGRVSLIGGPGSHLVHALAESNALVLIPESTGHLEAGAEVTVWLLE